MGIYTVRRFQSVESQMYSISNNLESTNKITGEWNESTIREAHQQQNLRATLQIFKDNLYSYNILHESSSTKAEIMAILTALYTCPKACEVTIVTESTESWLINESLILRLLNPSHRKTQESIGV